MADALEALKDADTLLSGLLYTNDNSVVVSPRASVQLTKVLDLVRQAKAALSLQV